MPVFDYSSVLCRICFNKVLVIVWDLLLAEGSVSFLKAIIVIIDEFSSILMACT